ITMGVFGSPALLGNHTRRHLEHVEALPRLVFVGARSPGDWTVFDDQGRAFVLDGAVAMRSDDIMILVRAAIDGIGIVYAPAFTVESAVARGDLVPLLGNYQSNSLDLQVVYNERCHQPVRVRALIEH